MGSAARTNGRRSAASKRRFVVLDRDGEWRRRLGRAQVLSCPDERSIQRAIESVDRDSLWISARSDRTDELVRALTAVANRRQGRLRPFHDLLLLESPRTRILPALHTWFEHVAGGVPDFKLLPDDQLADVLALPENERRDRFIGGVVDVPSGTLALARGDLDTLNVPLSLFRPSGRTAPTVENFALDDWGNSLRFGDYEAASDAVLYELDPAYRRRLSAKHHSEARGFGPSLRRLRKQRGLTQGDFPGLSAKTIARIERGEVEKPHGRTLRVIARRLGVEADEIESF